MVFKRKNYPPPPLHQKKRICSELVGLKLKKKRGWYHSLVLFMAVAKSCCFLVYIRQGGGEGKAGALSTSTMSRTLSFAYLSDVPIKGVEEEMSKHWRRGRGLSIPWRRCNQTTNQSLKNNFIFLLFYSINKNTKSNSIGFSSLTLSSTPESQCPDIPNIYNRENWKTFHAISHEHEPWPWGWEPGAYIQNLQLDLTSSPYVHMYVL